MCVFFFQAEDGIRDIGVTGVQTCALPISKNSIVKQYVKLFEMDGVALSFAEEVYDLIVDKAVEYKLGARGLRSIVESIMMDAMFEIPSKRKKSFEVTVDYAKIGRASCRERV